MTTRTLFEFIKNELLKITIINTLLYLGIFLTLSSCKSQSLDQDIKKSTKQSDLGTQVSELNETIWDIYQDQNSNFWFSSKEKGVFRYDGNNLTHFTKKDGLQSNQIRGIQEDTSGNLFFETTSGVSKYNGESFETLKILEAEDVQHDWILVPGDLWFRIGFNKKGPYRYDGQFLYPLEFTESPQEAIFYSVESPPNYEPYGVYKIYQDSKGALWFGTTSLGICRFDGNAFQWHYEEQLQTTAGGGDFGSRAIFEDRNGYFWFNNTRYRYLIQPSIGSRLVYKKETGLSNTNEEGEAAFPFFLDIEQDNEGDIWMVTYDQGVWRNDGEKLINYPIKDGETDVLLFTIFKDNQGVIWLGTHNAGVYRYNGKSFEKFKV